MAVEYKNLQGKNLKEVKKYMKENGFKYQVSYNPTNNLFYFVDRFFKTEAGAKRFYNNLATDKKDLKEL